MTARAERRAATRLVHPALVPGDGCPLQHARLTDQQRVGVLLQGAAVLAHLEQTGGALADGWRSAQLADDGRLRIGDVRRGRASAFAQEQLRDLLARLFGGAEVAGRGTARRAARRLASRWRQTLLGVDAERTVATILETAPFLWDDHHAVARRALVGEHWHGDDRQVWVAGLAPDRRRVLCREEDATVLAERLAGPQARRLWLGGDDEEDPKRVAGSGRVERAVRLWQLNPPRRATDALACAQALWSLGRFESALDTLARRRGASALILRASCQQELGELGAARATLGKLDDSELTARQTLDAADVALRVHANRREPEDARRWLARALQAAKGPLRPHGALLAALAAWDRGAWTKMSEHLDNASPLAADPDEGWRFHQAVALAALAEGDAEGGLRNLGRALGDFRRRLPRHRAGRLWNEIAVARVLAGDLSGAERACRHSLRLLVACDGPVPITLALSNLAEVRIRRGRFSGVADIIARSSAANRRAGNRRGLAQDLVLATRFELAQGRAEAALARVREAAEVADDDAARAPLAVFAARALGWLGRRSEARERLVAIDRRTLAELEPEERPALWALAGEPELALEAAIEGGPAACEPLWRALLEDRALSAADWRVTERLEPYRRARLTIDAVLVAPGRVEPDRASAAAAVLGRTGAGALATLAGDGGSWPAICRYLEADTQDAATAGRLLAAIGRGEARLSWRLHADEMVLTGGRGGRHELVERRGTGQLVLTSPVLDDSLRGVFALLARTVEIPRDEHSGRTGGVTGIVGDSPLLLASVERVRKLAVAPVPVLVLGESGTGKELIARLVHRSSPRAEAPFLAVNCAALSETLILSDLFGHVRGAFTGADRDRAGVFETARGGTVFLDEIGDLPPEAQGHLLRVLQEGEIRRVGESLPRSVDVRVVAATHRDLASMVEEGTFRQDLYFRLKVATVDLPPLRVRGDDLLTLTEHFLDNHRSAERSLGLSPAALERLRAHRWPGNVRELANVLEVAAALADGDRILPEHLDLPTVADERPITDYHRQIEDFRRRLVTDALEMTGGKQADAARELGLSRQALSYLVRQLDIK